MEDVLVVGAGLAGMAAAIEAAEQGATVLVVSAGPGCSRLAQGGVAAAIGADDAPQLHASDTLAAGAGACDLRAVRLLVDEGAAAVRWLARQGVRFDQESDGRPARALEAAHSRARVLHAGGDRSGLAIMTALGQRLRQHRGVPIHLLEGAELQCLLVDDGGVAGARLRRRGRAHDVRASATVLATGGYSALYDPTTNPPGCVGTGLIAALAAGAALADLEFVQFHPTVHVAPGHGFMATEALRGAGAWLTDRRGRRFLFESDPRGELAPRAVVARAIAQQLQESGEPFVLLDARPVTPDRLEREFPGFVARCRRVGLDPRRDPVPVSPAAHYTMGGIVTDLSGRTRVPGLLAAGECARTGVHGANRLASNSLLEAVVFGRRAGREAVAQAGRRRAESPARARALTDLDSGPGRLATPEVRQVLAWSAGPLRDARRLSQGLARLGKAGSGSGQAETARRLACLMLEAALIRQESRGAHQRTDRPGEEAAWASLQILVARQADASVGFELTPRPGFPGLGDRMEERGRRSLPQIEGGEAQFRGVA